MTRKYRRPMAALLLALAVVATATLGSAATLTVNAASMSTFIVTNPCDGTAQANPSDPVGNSGKYRDVEVVLPAGCSGTLQVAVLDDGSPLTTATVPVASGTITIDVGQQYSPDGITAVGTLDGWYLPISWSFGPPAPGPLAATCQLATNNPNITCEADVVLRDSWGTGYNLDIAIRDTRSVGNNDQFAWTIEIDFSGAGYPFVPAAADGSGVVPQSTCGDLPVLTLTGTTGWGSHHLLGPDETRSVWVQPKTSGSGALFTCP